MSVRLPVVYATRAAVDDAALVLPGVVIENAVREAILGGGMVRRDRDANVAVVVGRGWEATVRRGRSPLPDSDRAVWEVTRVSCVAVRVGARRRGERS